MSPRTPTTRSSYTGKSEKQSECIKKLRLCINWQMEQIDVKMAEQEMLKKTLESETAMKLEIETKLSKKIEGQREVIEKLARICDVLEVKLMKEIVKKTAAIEAFEKERESKKAAEISVEKSKEELKQVSDQLKTVQDNIKRLTEYNNSLEQYNINLQLAGAEKEKIIQRVQNEKCVMIDSIGGLKQQIISLKNQLDSSKVSIQEALSQKETMKNELQIQSEKVRNLTDELAIYKELTEKSVKDLDDTVAKVSVLEETCGSQREQIVALQRQLLAANAKIKLADISAVETISNFDEAKRTINFWHDGLSEAGLRISELLETKGNRGR